MTKKLKIAQIAPYWFSVPPKDYGGTERVVTYITEELVKRGHEVTLFASADSKTKAKLVSPINNDLVKNIKQYLDPAFYAINNYVNAAAFSQASRFDIIHSHASFFSFYFCDLVKTPVIHTIHNQLPRKDEIENEIYRKYKHLNYISISDEFRTHFPLNYIATVYHGLDLAVFPFSEKGGEALLWIGRASKNKGELDALEAVRKTDKKLVMAISLRADAHDYYETKIKPRLTEKITIHTDIKFKDTADYYGKAKAMIFPVEWKEPFGLILIESMACGTPVIAYARGSIAEIIKDGETGFLVNPTDAEKTGNWLIKKTGIAGLCEAIEKVYSLPYERYLTMRAACRSHVEANFTVSKMVDNYEKVYYSLL